MYPLKQKLLFNENMRVIDSNNLSPSLFAENLPDFEDSFDVTYRTEETQPSTLEYYAEEVFQFGTTEASKLPYMYGSYEMF